MHSPGLNSHPTYRNYNEELILHVPKLVTIFIYELFYGMDFFSVELMFRGVLVAGLVSILGKDAILPMAAMYVSIHFGKPLGETISSFFGGYFLGIITINSHNIIGGTIVHMGIAWLMELTSFMQLWWKDSSS